MTIKKWADGSSPREVILQASIKEFAENGYTSGSMNSIARDAGITRQLLLHYFPNKKALLIAVLDERDARLTTEWPDPVHVPFETFAAQFDQMFPAIYAEAEILRLSHRLIAEAADPDHPAHDWMVSRERAIRGKLEQVYSGAVERGELPPWVNASALAVTTLGAVEGIERQWLVDPELDWQAAIRSLRQLVVALARTAPAPVL
ncbi:TetR/AcrR family transcriptional regulator [Herbiconiux sp. 11R-BC]|uniref:TetR/AcrR family transcriptional regulator n=1 Tax=Herbiconiux sp. 11R-BC TaxID=3111637 RepID=UPI003C0A5C22